MKKFKLLVLFIGTTIVTTFMGNAAALAENFVVDGSNKALNTNNNFRKVDGNPIMSLWEFSSTDRDQQFDRISGNRGGTLLRHGSTGKCLNSHYLTNGGVVNTWPCDANDPDQNFNIISLGNGLSQIQRTGTNLCVDSPTRDNGNRIFHLHTIPHEFYVDRLCDYALILSEFKAPHPFIFPEKRGSFLNKCLETFF